MGRKDWHRRPRALAALVAGAAALAAAAGCGATASDTSVIHGKELFVAKCGTCHTLARAGTKGIQGPNLDQAFNEARKEGFGESTIEGVVHKQILYPTPTGAMPAKLVKGDDANDVAAYVAKVAAKPGKDTGLLAETGAPKQKALATAQAGKLELDVAQGGLLYAAKAAEAPAGPLTISSKNPQAVDHDIGVKGPGIPPKSGSVVNQGGVSTVSVDLKPGTYEFFCSVDGHEQAGMKGTLTVK